MSFLKKFFKSKPKPIEKAKLFLLSYEFKDPVQVTTLPDAPVQADLMLEAMDELISTKQIQGRMVGKKGWFLPGDGVELQDAIDLLSKKPLTIDELGSMVKLSPKRSLIALKDEMKRKQLINNFIFAQDSIYSKEFVENKWKSVLNSYDFAEEIINFKDLLSQIPEEEEVRNFVKDIVYSRSSPISVRQNGTVVLRELLPEIISEEVKLDWEGGKTEIKFEDLSEEYGLDIEQITDLILKMVNENEIDDVTVYTSDLLIRRRSTQ